MKTEPNENNQTITKFRFNLDNYTCVWIDDEKEIIIPKKQSGIGKQHERWFQLEENNPAHWVNYRQVFSPRQNKVLIKIWYKKVKGENRNDYSLTLPKNDSNIIEVNIRQQDEMVKKFDGVKNKEVWVIK